MSKERRSRVELKTTDEDVPTKSRCVVETVPPDRVGEMSHHPESSAGQSIRDKVAEDGNSDSGDSLFITQVPVPEAVRSVRRRRPTLTLDPISGEETANEDFILPSSDYEESGTDRERKGEINRLPNYSFSFLSEKGLRSTKLLNRHNRDLHYTLMGGFFKCVQECWESHQRGEDLATFQPTIDMVGVDITPISEEEEEGLEVKDIKVVEKKQFVVPSKTKRSKAWCSSEDTPRKNTSRNTRRPCVSGSESQRCLRKRANKHPMWKPSLKTAMFSDGRGSIDGNSSDDVLQEGETCDEREMSNENVEARPEWQNTGAALKQAKRKIFNEEENEEELSSNSTAAVCELSPQKSVERRQNRSAAGHRESQLESQTLLLSDDDDVLCSGTRVEKMRREKEDNKSVEEAGDQSREEVQGRDAEASVSAGITEVEEGAPSLTPAIDEPDPPESKQKKKKRKKAKSATEDVRRDVDGRTDGRVEEGPALNAENGGNIKRKKKNGEHVAVEGFNTDAPPEHITNGGKISKKKRKKELNDPSDLPQIPTEHLEMGDGLEKTLVSQKTPEFSHARRKKHKKKKKSTFNDNHVEGSCTDVDFTNGGTNLSGSTGLSVKKKKKSTSETCVDVSYTPEEDKSAADAQETEAVVEQDEELVTKKKRKKISANRTEDTEIPSDYSASARKKEKKTTSYFLVADEEEKASETHGGGNSEDARDPRAEKPAISEGLAATAAETTTSLGESGKKKKKRSATQENVERTTEFEEPKGTGRVLSETGVRKKKKQKTNASGTERLESAADVEDSQMDEAVVWREKKKKKSKREIPPAAAEAPESEKSALSSCVSPSPNQDASLSLSTPGNKTLSENKEKKRKKEKAANKRVLEAESLIDSAELETPKTKKERRDLADGRLSSSLSKASLSQLETSSSDGARKNKHMKGRRRLLNPNEDFL